MATVDTAALDALWDHAANTDGEVRVHYAGPRVASRRWRVWYACDEPKTWLVARGETLDEAARERCAVVGIDLMG